MSQTSPDPHVQAIIDRRRLLQSEAERLDYALSAYATAAFASGMSPAVQKVSALQHYSMLNNQKCGCRVCADWDSRKEELDAAMRLIPEGHRWSICACSNCRFVGRIQLNYMAASNLRDLMIEVSFHAKYHSAHGDRVMQWFEGEIAQPRYTVDWCAYEIGRRSVEEWIDRCEKALSPALSGIVFAAGRGHAESIETQSVSSLENWGALFGGADTAAAL